MWVGAVHFCILQGLEAQWRGDEPMVPFEAMAWFLSALVVVWVVRNCCDEGREWARVLLRFCCVLCSACVTVGQKGLKMSACRT